MSDERSSAGRSRAPDHIPDHIIKGHQESARLQVIAERIYNESATRPPRARHRLTAVARDFGWWWVPLLAWLVALVSAPAWLVLDPDSPFAFLVASVSTIAAISGTVGMFGRRWSSRRRSKLQP